VNSTNHSAEGLCTRRGIVGRAAAYARAKRAEVAILLAMNSVYFFSFFHRVAVPGTIFDELQSSYHTSATVITALGAVVLYIYSGMQLVAGMLNDRFGAAKVFTAGGLLLTLGSLCFPFAPSLPYLFAGRAVVGLGASLIYLSVIKAMDTLFDPGHFAPLFGVSVFLGYSGGLVGTFPFERAVNAVGWREALFGAGLLCLAGWLTAGALFRATGRLEYAPRRGSRLLLDKVLRNRRCVPVLACIAINFSIYFLVQATIGKKLLLDYLRLDSAVAAFFTFLMMLVTMCAILGGGFLVRLIGNRFKPLMLAGAVMTLAASGLLLMCLHAGLGAGWFLVAYVLLAAAAVSQPAGAALIRDLNPAEGVGTAIGWANAVAYLAVAVLTNAAGFLMDAFRNQIVVTPTAVIYPRPAYELIFGVCCVLGLVSVAVAVALREPRPAGAVAAAAPTSFNSPA
jgi:MFS family permease